MTKLTDKTTEQKNINYGTVTHSGVEYQLTDEAVACNGVDQTGLICVVYCANAILLSDAATRNEDTPEYTITWDTTDFFRDCERLYRLEQQRNDNTEHGEDTEYIDAEIAALEAAGCSTYYAEDGSNACDWDEPVRVEHAN